ncbi:MAG: hypothetical protein GY943_07425, partial [Chloroflexi bacterium]|nr:hypothetical protein [Chloroflexota bacterium]
MWEGNLFFSNLSGLFRWHRILRFSFIGLPPLIAVFGVLGLFSLVDIKTSSALGTIRYVTFDGSGSVCSIGTPCELQTAVDQSAENDEVRVAAGIYSAGTPILLINETITVSGGYNSSDWVAVPNPQSNRTILDGQDTVQVVRIDGIFSPTIEGFEIRNGLATEGAGLYNAAGGALIRNNQIYDNNGTGGSSKGAGLSDRGSATIENNSIYDNGAVSQGGGIYVDNNANNGLTLISFNDIYSNTATSFGGGIFLPSNGRAFVEGNMVHHNQSANGAGFGTFGISSEPANILQNNMFYQNQADSTGGGILAVGIIDILNNTIAANSADTNGGGIFVDDNGATSVQISNTIVVSNSSNGTTGIHNAGGTISGDYNNIFNNTSDPTFTNTISTDPQFINYATFNLHLRSGSPNINAGDLNTSPLINIDIDGQVRPNEARVDIGADEFYASVPDFTLLPALKADFVDRGTTAVYTHTLENIGTVNDGYNIVCSNDRGWTVICPSNIANLNSGNSTNLQTSVDVPGGESALTVGTTHITATSVASPTLSRIAIIQTSVAPMPGVSFTPNYTSTLLPGDMITFTHLITNTGDSQDIFNITVDSDPGGWALIVPNGAFSVPLSTGASASIRVRVTVPPFAEAGLGNTAVIKAASTFNPQIFATVVNTVTAKSTVGTRYVSTGGTDTNNNCTQLTSPCASIKHAVGQAADTDEVRIRTGTYSEEVININSSIAMSGGWNANFKEQADPDATKIVPSSSTRVFIIAAGSAVQPSISNMTLEGGNGVTGGAIQIGRTSQPSFTSLVLKNNQAASLGGGIYVGENTFVTISNTHFLTNTASTTGGAIFNAGGVVLMQNSSFINNEATTQKGGAIYVENGQLTTANTLFYNNRAGSDGGAIFSEAGIVDDDHNTYVANSAADEGGAVYNNTATLDINSSIIVSNTAVTNAAVHDESALAEIAYSDIWDNSTTPATNVTLLTNNISEDPLFVDEKFHLGLGSPAIDTGNPASALQADFEDDFRPSDQGYDIGYDELPGCVAKRDNTIFGSIQAAVDMQNANSDLIRVSGTCRGVNTILVNDNPISQTVHLTETVTIQGGWNNTFSKRTFDPTYIDPEGRGRGIFVSGGSSVQPIIETITVVNGDATGLGGGPADEDAGGGIYNLDADPTFTGISVLTSTAVLGGGIYNNDGTFSMAARFPENSSQDVIPSDLYGNSATDGGAIYLGGGVVSIDTPTIHHNTAVNGGGIYGGGGAITVTNAILDNNSSTGNGGAIYNNNTDPDVYFLHMTVYSNTTTGTGGGIYNAAGAPIVRSNIFESNQAFTGQAFHSISGPPDADYNYYYDQAVPVLGFTMGSHSINNGVPPGLLDPLNRDFHLADDAPAVDAGDPDSPITSDFEEDPRPSNQSVDMGADEVAGCRVRLNDTFYGSIQAA